MKPVHKNFNVIVNGEMQCIEWTQQEEFIQANLKPHPFGELAKQTEAPIKAVFTFKTDGNIQGFRGDRYTGKPIEMIQKLWFLSRQYFKENKIHEVKIYDNRNLLPINTRIILHWKEGKGTVINLLPVYSHQFNLQNNKKA